MKKHLVPSEVIYWTTLLYSIFTGLTPKGQLFVEWKIENLGRFLKTQFWLDVYEIMIKGADMYLLDGNIIFFSNWVYEPKVILP